MCKTTTASNSVASEKVRRVFPACTAEVTGKLVKIIVYDPKRLIESRSDLRAALTQVQDFYNGLKNQPGLPADLVSDLGLYSFQAEYKASAPSETEIKQLGRMDFPFYVFHSPPLSPDLTSVEEIQALMERHQVSSILWLRMIDETDPEAQAYIGTGDVYESLEKDWINQLVLGFGFPGSYTFNGNCHKLGIIKIDAVLANMPPGVSGAQRFRGVLEHELGHMFSLRHEAGTIMNEKYEGGMTHFSAAQIDVIRDTLKQLSP
jgi:hypothetical protein